MCRSSRCRSGQTRPRPRAAAAVLPCCKARQRRRRRRCLPRQPPPACSRRPARLAPATAGRLCTPTAQWTASACCSASAACHLVRQQRERRRQRQRRPRRPVRRWRRRQGRGWRMPRPADAASARRLSSWPATCRQRRCRPATRAASSRHSRRSSSRCTRARRSSLLRWRARSGAARAPSCPRRTPPCWRACRRSCAACPLMASSAWTRCGWVGGWVQRV